MRGIAASCSVWAPLAADLKNENRLRRAVLHGWPEADGGGEGGEGGRKRRVKG